jgi:hypothetical protein
VALVRCSSDGPDDFQLVADDLICPVAAFTSDGFLVVVSEDGGEIYATNGDNVVRCGTFPGLGIQPVAAMPAGRAGRFAVLTPDGTVRLYQIPKQWRDP